MALGDIALERVLVSLTDPTSTEGSHQNADGSWTESETTGTGFPRVFYLRYDMYRNNWPLLALATWQNAQSATQPS